MPAFQIGTTVETTENIIEITLVPPLLGTHEFSLEVVDEDGNKSAAVKATVVIKDTIKPTAVLAIQPTQVVQGQAFKLDGSASSDVAPGRIVKNIWTMIS